MAGGGKQPKSDKSSLKFRCNPIDGAYLEFVEFNCEAYAPSSSNNNKRSGERYESKSVDLLSTTDLISVVGRVCCTTHPLCGSQLKTHLKNDKMDLKKANVFYYPSEGEYFSVNLVTTSHSSPTKQANLDCLKEERACKCRNLIRPGNVFDWMSEVAFARLKQLLKSSGIVKKNNGEYFTTRERNNPTICFISSNASSHANNMSMSNVECRTEVTKPQDSSSSYEKYFMHIRSPTTSPCAGYFLEDAKDIEESDDASRTSISRLPTDFYVNPLASHTSAYEESQHNVEEDRMQENDMYQLREVAIKDKFKLNIFSSTQDRPNFALARQEHAFAGAFAGIFVSLCLHPLDTIKTITQSCRTDKKSIDHIMRSIISQRGVEGLYRGIASNIVSSAPVSAVYTFTYETVKGALLPLFAKEYHSLAHCMAGGCASIATSFIFTPSDCIKQQMQVSSHYQNCWNAFTGIVKKGGLSSLYAGWGAVLCRNVPHSIIKFYIYESLKQLMLSSLQSNGQNSTLLTLVCGGIAGSTAAFFTTPFDVVKTRLQTQIPGSNSQYDGVCDTLKNIAQHEGLKGLCRGLTPRLLMYMTQGALFFASYESFKSLLSPEIRRSQRVECEPIMDEDLASLSGGSGRAKNSS